MHFSKKNKLFFTFFISSDVKNCQILKKKIAISAFLQCKIFVIFVIFFSAIQICFRLNNFFFLSNFYFNFFPPPTLILWKKKRKRSIEKNKALCICNI